MGLIDYFNLLRVQQWYKNLVVFLAIFFSGNLFKVDLFLVSAEAFLAVSLMSSVNYILNDLVDLEKDKLHPENKFRPLSAERVSKKTAGVIAVILFLGSTILAGKLGGWFLAAVLSLFLLTQAYTFFLKKIVLADVLTIASLFVIRAISGGLAIKVVISPWLIMGPFFLALFLAVGKRHSNLLLLKIEASKSRAVLQDYTLSLTNSLMIISTTLLIISYALYSFLSKQNNLLFTLPLVLFCIFRFYYLITSGSSIARSPEKVITDRQIRIGMGLGLVLAVILIYL
ncbi:MAG TPA: UbiA prenyltransferase family protein [Candidatus Nanoarchaeia archaeon]|nr:UbiA prenyltransferase family protein [Candidatus Nanoarchaeia archaeon]